MAIGRVNNMNEMNFHRADAIARMESFKSILLKLPRSAGKQLLMSAMEDYRMELLNDMQERETQQKQTAAHLLKDLQNIETERQRVREGKQVYWGLVNWGGLPYSKWDLTMDWLTMTNDLFFNKYGFNWTPSIRLQNDAKHFMNKYGNISEDDLKKLYGALGETKAPIPGDSCMTKPLTEKTIAAYTEDKEEMYKYLSANYIRSGLKPLTQIQLNILGGQKTPGYKMTN